MLPAPCHSLQVIQNPSEMQSSVPDHGLISPVKCLKRLATRRIIILTLWKVKCLRHLATRRIVLTLRTAGRLMQSLRMLHGFPTASWRSTLLWKWL